MILANSSPSLFIITEVGRPLKVKVFASLIELSKYNIRVNTVHPDCVYDTDVWSKDILTLA